jgi:hypothetical protein
VATCLAGRSPVLTPFFSGNSFSLFWFSSFVLGLAAEIEREFIARLSRQGHQQAGDREIGRVRAVDPLCVVGPAQSPTLPWPGTRPGLLGDTVSGLVSGVKE